MSDVLRQLAALQTAEEQGNALLAKSQAAAEQQRQKAEANIAIFIGKLLANNQAPVPIFAEVYRKGRAGDRRSSQLGGGYHDVHTGYLALGTGWVVQKYDHNDGDIQEGVFMFGDGTYTRGLREVTRLSSGGQLENVPALPFYTTGPRLLKDQITQPLVPAELFPVTADFSFAHPEGVQMLARSLRSYGITH